MWIIGVSGSGKTTLARAVFAEARKLRSNVVMLDGDVMREIWGNDLGYTREDRLKNAARCGRLCRLFEQQNIHVVAAFMAPFAEMRRWNRENLGGYYEVCVKASERDVVRRDPKGVYRAALRSGAEVPGVNQDFDEPDNADETIENNGTLETFIRNGSRLAHILVGSA